MGKQEINNNKTIIKNRLRETRLQKNLSQDELANLANTTAVTISYIENGKFCPNLALAFDLSRVLETPIEGLFYPEDSDNITEPTLTNNGRVKRKKP